MEKKTPHCNIRIVKTLVHTGKIRVTNSAQIDAAKLGFEWADVLEVLVSLTAADFYKSMTTHVDHTIWQDVYRPYTKAGAVYLKLTVTDDLLIVSFKEL